MGQEEAASGDAQERFSLDVKEKFLMERVVQPRAVVESPKNMWLGHLGIWFSGGPDSAGEQLESVILKGFSNLNNSVIP